MLNWNLSVDDAVGNVKALLSEANSSFYRWMVIGAMGDEESDRHQEMTQWYINTAFIQTLELLEGLGLPRTYERFAAEFERARKQGLSDSEMGFEEPHLIWPPVINQYLNGLISRKDEAETSSVIRNLTSILRAATYSITDERVFQKPPRDESEVHARMEAVLRCVFPDLLTKPALAKAIKNFVPDTGLPTLRTLLEYKYVPDQAAVKRVADEVLADTRGYHAPEWRNFVFVIYETRRLKAETEWNQLLRDCGAGDTISAVVLLGETGEA